MEIIENKTIKDKVQVSNEENKTPKKMKYYVRLIGGQPEEVSAKRYWSLARNKKNYTDIYYEKGKAMCRVLTIRNFK